MYYIIKLLIKFDIHTYIDHPRIRLYYVEEKIRNFTIPDILTTFRNFTFMRALGDTGCIYTHTNVCVYRYIKRLFESLCARDNPRNSSRRIRPKSISACMCAQDYTSVYVYEFTPYSYILRKISFPDILQF